MSEWIVSDIDLGCDGAYLSHEEIIRCKDCKWYKTIYSWNGKEHHVCVREANEPVRESDDYCSYAERKDK